MSESNKSPIAIIIAVAIIAAVAGIFIGKSGGNEQQAKNDPKPSAPEKQEPTQSGPDKPKVEPEKPSEPEIFLPEGLVAYYPFNGNAKDQSGNENDGEVKGAALAPDRHGNANQAYSFDGVDDMIDIKDHESIRPDHITISVWAFQPTIVSGDLVAKIEPTDGIRHPKGEQYQLSLNSVEGHLFFIKRNSGGRPAVGWQRLHSKRKIPSNQWNMITATWDGQTQRVYENGKLMAENPLAVDGGIDDVQGGNLLIGRSWTPSQGHFKGKIDDVRIYNRALSAEEVAALFEHENPKN